MYKTDNQKDLLYSTRDYIENLIITCKIKEYEYIYIYMYQNHFEVHLKLTQYCKSMILQLKKNKQKTLFFLPLSLRPLFHVSVL